MSVTQSDYTVGSIIEFQALGDMPGGRSGWVTRQVLVEAKSSDVKDGEPGFDGKFIDGDKFPVWGYDSQIVRVVRR